MTLPRWSSRLLDQGVVDPVQLDQQLLGAALRPERVDQRLGQRREAGDVGEQRRPGRSPRQIVATGEGVATIGREVCERGFGHGDSDCRVRISSVATNSSRRRSCRSVAT